MVSPRDEHQPLRFGPYRVTRKLGEGGMGAVYEARHSGLDKRVAIKVLQPSAASGNDLAERFRREGLAAARVRHPHVVDVYDVGVEGDTAYLVMELLDGADLAALLAARTRLSVEHTVEILLPVISGVDAAHRAGVVHRDLKPENIFLSQRMAQRVHPIVVDFGISKLNDSDVNRPDLTKSRAVFGTPYYLSPEQARGSKNADARSDQYALGVILYECLTGKKPFDGETIYEVLTALATAEVAPPSRVVTDVPIDLDVVAMRAMSRDPEKRFPTLREFGCALIPFADPITRALWGPEFGDGRSPTPSECPSAPSNEISETSMARTRLGSSASTKPRIGLHMLGLWAALGATVVVGSAFAVRSWRGDHAPAPASVTPEKSIPSASSSAVTSASAPEPAVSSLPSTSAPPPASPPSAIIPPAAAPASAGAKGRAFPTKAAPSKGSTNPRPAQPSPVGGPVRGANSSWILR